MVKPLTPTIKHLLISLYLVIVSLSYIQFQLIRVPHETKVYNYGIVHCLTNIPKSSDKDNERRLMLGKGKKAKEEDSQENDQDNDKEDEDDDDQADQEEMKKEEEEKVQDQNNFKQICYEKDINYAIELYNQRKQLMMISIDLTVPISWVKSQKCFITQTHKKCDRIQINSRDQLGKLTKKFKQLLKNPFSNKTKKKKNKKQQSNQQALIQGSSQVVKGLLQKTKTLKFKTKDSGRLTRFLDVIMLGLFIIGINSQLNLQNTTFINALQISPALNYLCDGAISLRFDQNSENSFLKEMTQVAQSEGQTYVTIFIGENNQTMTIGDLSVKNSAQGLSGVTWIPVYQDSQHGKLPKCQTIQLTSSSSQTHKSVPAKHPLVLTLSSSSITIPQPTLQLIFSRLLPKKQCSLNPETRYMQCLHLSSTDIQQKQLNFVTDEKSIAFPLKQLILSTKKHVTILNIKSSLDERYIILGEPLFKKYFVVLDYKGDRIGISMQRKKFVDPLFDVVTLIRFVIWTFLTGSCIILFILPVQRCYAIFVNKMVTANKQMRKRRPQGTHDQKRKINAPYHAIQQEIQNPYDDIKGKIQEVVHEDVEGI